MRLDDDLRAWRSCRPWATQRQGFGTTSEPRPHPSRARRWSYFYRVPQLDCFVSIGKGVTGFGPTGDDVDDRCYRGGFESVACGRQRRQRQPAFCADVQCLRLVEGRLGLPTYREYESVRGRRCRPKIGSIVGSPGVRSRTPFETASLDDLGVPIASSQGVRNTRSP
jgi:hypothetical protein